MNKLLHDILLYIRSAIPAPVSKTRTAAAITTTGTTNLIAAPGASVSLKIWRVWVAMDNAHASAVTTVSVQDTDANVLAKASVHQGSAINGFVDFDGQVLTANKGLDIVVAAGTPTGHIVAYTTTV